MRTLENQKRLYNQLWEQNSPIVATKKTWQPDPIPIYCIGIWLPDELHEEIQQVLDRLRSFQPDAKHQWLQPNQLHITLELPGRLGKHFQEDDVPKMQEWLQEICKTTDPFQLELGNISCFTNVPFREVYDKECNIFQLHNAIAKKIPWTEEPTYRFENYTPHMSLCYPGKDATPMVQHPDFQRELPATKMPVGSIYFTVWCDAEGTPEIEDLAIIELGTGKLLPKKHTSSKIPT